MKIQLPQVGESVTEGIIGRWLRQVGDHVERYDPLVEVVTDKVSMEMPSPATGTLVGIFVDEDQTVRMGTVIAEIEVEGEEEEQEEETLTAVPPTPPTEAEELKIDRTGVLLKDVAPVGPTGSGGSTVTEESVPSLRPQRYSPAVQRLAQAHQVDLARIAGTGVGGRVTRKDVEAHIDTVEAGTGVESRRAIGPDEERVALTPVRRMVAQNMVRSASEIPQAWSIVEVDVTGMVRLREAVKEGFQRREGVGLSYLAFVIAAVAGSLGENPLLNSSWGGDAIILKRRINVGMAVASAGGLVVPVIHDADSRGIAELARAVDDLTSRGRTGKLALDDVREGTFTVNNTGALGSVMSRPLVNPPQAAIMTTEAIVRRPVAMDDAVVIRSIMNVCLTFDHRILDGAEAGAFINSVKDRLEAIGPETRLD